MKNSEHPRETMYALHNDRLMASILDEFCQVFDKMYAKRAFVHHYMEMDEAMFTESREDV